MTPTPSALFEVGADRVVATELSRGPWDPRHCHGGPVAAILARAVETATDPETDPSPWQIARLTFELERPVPVGVPLDVEVHIERPGRTISLVAGALRGPDHQVARVRALRIRRRDIEVPTEARPPRELGALGAAGTGRRERVTSLIGDLVAYHSHACEHRFTTGGWLERGPSAIWTRLTVPVVEGEVPSGVQRLAAAADFGSGVSAVLALDRYTFINADLSIHLLRPPVGPWIGLASTSWFGPEGAGVAETELADASGYLGRSVQSLVLDQRTHS